MEKLKNNKGITLVMLVVTIIVLLILAGISISAITGGDSSMDKAKKAKDETAIKAEMEELQKIINQSAAKGIRHGNYSGSADSQTIRDALKKNKLIEENPEDVIIDGKNGWKVTGVKTGQKYKIRYNGEVTRIEELEPTKIYGKIADGVLYLRATEQTGYTEGTKWNDATITKVIIEEPIAPSTCEEMFSICSSLQEIENIENLHTENAVSMKKMFYNCTALKQLDVSNFDTSNVKNMNYMFGGQSVAKGKMSLERIIGLDSFDTSKVTDMSYMFSMCVKLKTLDVSSFDTGNVTNMACMFSGGWADKRFEMELEKITGLENFKTGNVKYMQCMFYQCAYLTSLNLKNFDTSNVTNMYFMFCYCRSLTNLDISNFNTKKVTTMERMFGYCFSLKTLDISSFDTQLVNNMAHMFIYCNNLITIYASNSFVTTNVSNSDKIFYCSTKIKGGQGTISGYNDNIKYAHIDGGSSNPGYFTSK